MLAITGLVASPYKRRTGDRVHGEHLEAAVPTRMELSGQWTAAATAVLAPSRKAASAGHQLVSFPTAAATARSKGEADEGQSSEEHSQPRDAKSGGGLNWQLRGVLLAG